MESKKSKKKQGMNPQKKMAYAHALKQNIVLCELQLK